ncbi:molybdopterin biosynthesis MoaE protein [Cellulomonas flavigena DSM 20109]|uniref:Molybdopterin biosynthesis MoaE protein n=1 Tax=Cellulomonas flavigena (strain ATCC 482 / DSM 20109 / BCRC 11376 / JCM 18109 / NBRC 3775 / NCIMB 8073 / NRS 134) TaxID=446466 RepID=D5UEJ0_CELFN|nr:molybdenum cofactor biosynthesis protein MoaE [Cellulomonas flavigena]ADG74650.1 molybdopterin biosynthesis MoaE protein [Cellulomonas flavigena DSM 20109]
MTTDDSRLHAPARRVAAAHVTTDPVDVDALARAVADDAAGAVVTFAGVVRDHDRGRAVTALEYVAHPDASDVVARVVADVVAAHPVDAVACVHRVGALAVGDCALGVAVAAAHRHEAFAVAALLVDAVKEHLPVWKRQDLAAGGHEWVNSA